MHARMLAGGIVALTFAAPFAQSIQPASPQIEWLRTNVIPLKTVEAGHGFDDLQKLKAAIGDARIVSLGEATHGTREIFQMKHRLVEYLASELGFTIFSIEANIAGVLPRQRLRAARQRRSEGAAEGNVLLDVEHRRGPGDDRMDAAV
jgi:erythromycin esterase-like protein